MALTAGVLAVPIADVLPAAASAPPPAAGCALRTATFTNSTPVAIPTGPAVVSSNIVVSGAGAYLRDADVQTFITHTFAADLDVTVQSPAGTIVTLTSDNGAGNDNVFNGTVWDDDANPGGQVPYVTNNGLASDHAYVNLTLASPLVPEEAMGAFVGENPNGTWTLTVSDDLAGDGGSLDSWGLTLATLAAAPTTSVASFSNPTDVAIPTGPAVVSSSIVVAGAPTYLQDVNAQTFIAHTFAADLDVTVQSPAGTIVTLTSDNGAGNDNVFNGTVWDDDANPGGQVPYVTNNGVATDHAYVNLTAANPLVPEEAMGAFIGENPNGTWTLTASDDLAGDGGTIDSWGLALTGGSCPFRPDGRIKRGLAGTMVGNNTYNGTGIHQTRTGAAHAGQSVTYYLSFQNDSQVNDALRIRGRAGGGAFSIVYRHGATNITSQVVAGTFVTPSLAPQAAYSIRAVVTVHNSAPLHSSQTRKVRVRSASDTTRTDVVRFITSRN